IQLRKQGDRRSAITYIQDALLYKPDGAEATAALRELTSEVVNAPDFAPAPDLNRCPSGCIKPEPGCAIKGNVESDGSEKIYYVRGSRFYDTTVIDPRFGERWFCTEQEAQDNGWRKSKQ